MIQEEKLPVWIVGQGLTHSESAVRETKTLKFLESRKNFLSVIVGVEFADEILAFGRAAFF